VTRAAPGTRCSAAGRESVWSAGSGVVGGVAGSEHCPTHSRLTSPTQAEEDNELSACSPQASLTSRTCILSLLFPIFFCLDWILVFGHGKKIMCNDIYTPLYQMDPPDVLLFPCVFFICLKGGCLDTIK
jgi:hypothetical protein